MKRRGQSFACGVFACLRRKMTRRKLQILYVRR